MSSDNINVIINRLQDPTDDIRKMAIDSLHDEIRRTAGKITKESMELFDIVNMLKSISEKYTGNEKLHLNDLISVLSVSSSENSVEDTIKYRLKGNVTNLNEWGHQYTKQLVKGCLTIRNGQIADLDYECLIEPLTEHLFKHNCEIEAIDFILSIGSLLLDEVSSLGLEAPTGRGYDKLELISKFVDESNYGRVYEYLMQISSFYSISELILDINKTKPSRYLVFLLKERKYEEAVNFVKQLPQGNTRKQCLYILARVNVYFETEDEQEKFILTNQHVPKYYSSTVESLEIKKSKKKMLYYLKLNIKCLLLL